MRAAALVLLFLAAAFGALLLMPRRGLLAVLSRRAAAATHGMVGATGLCVFLAATTTLATETTWLATGLLTAGLVAGVTIFLTCRHRRMPPPLILALHVVLAGLGTMLCIGLILR